MNHKDTHNWTARPEHHTGRPIETTASELIETVLENGPWNGDEGIDREAFTAAALDCLDCDTDAELTGNSYDLCRSVLGFHVWALIPAHEANNRSHVAYRALQHFSMIAHETAAANWFEERAYGRRD